MNDRMKLNDYLKRYRSLSDWEEVYGEGSENYKKYMTSKMIGYMNLFMWVCGERSDLIKDVLEYGKEHTNNKHKKLFK